MKLAFSTLISEVRNKEWLKSEKDMNFFFLKKRGHLCVNIIFGLITMYSDYFEEMTHSIHIFLLKMSSLL